MLASSILPVFTIALLFFRTHVSLRLNGEETLTAYDGDFNTENDEEANDSPLAPLWKETADEQFARHITCEVIGPQLTLECIYTLPYNSNSTLNKDSITRVVKEGAEVITEEVTTEPNQIKVTLHLTREDYLYSTVQLSFYDIPQFLCNSKSNCQLDNWYVVQRGLIDYANDIVRLPLYSRILLDIQGFVYSRVRNYAMTHRLGLGAANVIVGDSINNAQERYEQRRTLSEKESDGVNQTIYFQAPTNKSEILSSTREEILLVDTQNNAMSKERLTQHNLTKAMEKAYTIAIVLTPTSRIVKPPNEVTKDFPIEKLLRPTEEMLNSIAFELFDLRFLFKKVFIYYGYAVIPSRHEEFIEYCNYINDFFETRLNKFYLEDQLEVVCMGYHYPLDLTEDDDVDFPSNLTVNPGIDQYILNSRHLAKNLFYNKHYDVRNDMLTQTWLVHQDVDFYIFLDIDPYLSHLYSTSYMEWAYSEGRYKEEMFEKQLPFYRTRWLLATLKPLLFGGLYEGLGMTFMHCPSEYDPNFVKLPYVLPYNFAVSRTTLKLLLTGGMLEDEQHMAGDPQEAASPVNRYAFYPDITKAENNILLFAVMSTMDSSFCLDDNVIVNYSPPPPPVHFGPDGSVLASASGAHNDPSGSPQSKSPKPLIHQHLDYHPDEQSFMPQSRMISNFMLQLYIRTTRKLLIRNLIRYGYTKNGVTSALTDALRILLEMHDHDESCLKVGQLLQNQVKFEKYLPELCKLKNVQSYIIDLQRRYETNILQREKGRRQRQSNLHRVSNDGVVLLRSGSAATTDQYNQGARVAVITAIYGDKGYEKTLKRFAMQTVSTDFICFTDSPHLTSTVDHQGKANHHGWIIDRTPYHLQSLQEDIDLNQTDFQNSLFRNRHPFNIAKFYKTSFHTIPRIRDAEYDIVIWIDGTIRITDHEMSAKILSIFEKRPEETMVVFEHSRHGNLEEEVDVSLLMPRYNRRSWQGIPQPLQNVSWQYESYLKSAYFDESDPYRLVTASPRFRNTTGVELDVNVSGETSKSKELHKGPRNYDPEFWKPIQEIRPQFGVWCTCFIAFNMKHQHSLTFLKAWYSQIKQFTTQDQVSFAYLSQAMSIYPYTLPDDNIFGNLDFNTLFIKAEHGQ